MDKIIVELRIPAIDKIYDVKIPRDIQIWEATQLIVKMVSNLHPVLYASENEAMLVDYESGKVIAVNALVADSGLTNGARVMLI